MTADREFAQTVIGLIADTFGVRPQNIDLLTTADDVDGWDSLGHSVLMARLSRKLGIEIGEDTAATAKTVGMLIDALWGIRLA